MKARVYVDGFNLYYGAVKGTPFKWLNLVQLAGRLLPRDWKVDRLHYFTARVSGMVDPLAPARQRVYLKALATLPNVEIHYGRFVARTEWRPLSNLPVAGRRIDAPTPVTLPRGNHSVLGHRPQTLPVGVYPAKRSNRRLRHHVSRSAVPNALIAEFRSMEEKGSDVNLATHLIYDACRGMFELAVVLSNDTDLEVPIRMVAEDLGRPVMVVCPGRSRVAPQLRKVATHVRHIHTKMLRDAQFPDILPGSAIAKPEGW